MRSDHERTEPSSIERTDAGQYRTGTTIVGVRAEEGVVLAGDRRMSVGRGFTASKNVRKVTQVHPAGAMAIAGVDVATLGSGGFDLFDRDRREQLLDEAGLRQGS